MGAEGFEVDYVTLADLGQQLANLRGEFSKGDDAVAPLLGTISDGGLRDKLRDFAENWSDKREGIVKRLDQAAGFATAAAKTYADADAGGAAAFGVDGG